MKSVIKLAMAIVLARVVLGAIGVALVPGSWQTLTQQLQTQTQQTQQAQTRPAATSPVSTTDTPHRNIASETRDAADRYSPVMRGDFREAVASMDANLKGFEKRSAERKAFRDKILANWRED